MTAYDYAYKRFGADKNEWTNFKECLDHLIDLDTERIIYPFMIAEKNTI